MRGGGRQDLHGIVCGSHQGVPEVRTVFFLHKAFLTRLLYSTGVSASTALAQEVEKLQKQVAELKEALNRNGT